MSKGAISVCRLPVLPLLPSQALCPKLDVVLTVVPKYPSIEGQVIPSLFYLTEVEGFALPHTFHRWEN